MRDGVAVRVPGTNPQPGQCYKAAGKPKNVNSARDTSLLDLQGEPRQNQGRIFTAVAPEDVCWVGPERPSAVAPGGILRPALRVKWSVGEVPVVRVLLILFPNGA
jgi:hypothetical protein